ncbi:MAG: efflux RND transporter periplasmic adaptor subunit [Firmicutes bacterium]|nr:efflux RND transporter periplasmic adaptor subunit [Bacillota bacterium]
MLNRTLLYSLLLPCLGAGLLGCKYLERGKSTPPDAPPPLVQSVPLRAEGRFVAYPGADLVLGTDLGGTIREITAQEGDDIRQGQVLVRLDSRSDDAALREATARIKELDTDIGYQVKEVQRQESLAQQGIVTQQSLDAVRNQLSVLRARRDAAVATTERLKVVLAKLVISAPFNGSLLTRLVQPGETVLPGGALVRVAKMDQVRVEAEIDEFDLSRIRVGAPVTVRAEGQAGSWKGHVEEIPTNVTGRRLRPQDPSRPADTRVLLVKVALNESTPLKLGQRVELEISQTNH